jgi:hypothetical protein
MRISELLCGVKDGLLTVNFQDVTNKDVKIVVDKIEFL